MFLALVVIGGTSRAYRVSVEEKMLAATAKIKAAFLVKGYSNAQIADRLSICESTVKTHIRSMMAKLDARDRVRLAVVALQLQLVPWV